MGILIGVGNTKPQFPYDYYYGIEWDSTVADPACTRIGRPELHASLPVQKGMRRCLLKDNGTVNYYLHPSDSTKRDTGAPARLDGTDGQVMVEIPEHYRKFETEGTKHRCFLSLYPLPGFHRVPRCYRSAYEAAMDRSVPSEPKLASVVNASPAFRGGKGDLADRDGTYRSLLGRPATYISLREFRAAARNRGAAGKNSAGWNCDVYDIQKTCYWLYAVEYANFNCQLPFTSQLTAEGYRQGGLGEGVTNLVYKIWLDYNGYLPVVPCGYTNNLGNQTGVRAFTMPIEYGDLTTHVPSYRGLENPFGHVSSNTDGCWIRIKSDEAGGLSEFYVCKSPDKFESGHLSDYQFRGLLPRTNGFIKTIMMGEYGDNLPSSVGGEASSFFTDYIVSAPLPDSGEIRRVLLMGSDGIYGLQAGLTDVRITSSINYVHPIVGTRLCFIPE